MKKLIFFLTLFVNILLNAQTTYYISPTGSDATGTGTLDSPWFSLSTAWSHTVAGDIINMRSGTYYYTVPQSITGRSGTASKHITVQTYPADLPKTAIFNGGKMDTQNHWDIMDISNINYADFKNFRITNLPQPVSIPNSNGYYGISMGNYSPSTAVWVTNITFERIELDHIGGWGCTIFEHCTDITWLNCDSHHNMDPYSSKFGGDNYGGSDGWESAAETSTRIHFIGCRSWWNSDDGWDNRYASGLFTYDHCWAFRNGYIPNTYTLVGNGEGFKLQGTNPSQSATTNILRIVQNCLSFDNQAGYEGVAEANYTGMQIFNNIAFRNYVGINFQNTAASTTILRNNLLYANVNLMYLSDNFTHDHNSFDIPLTFTNSNFLSTDTTGVSGPRQSDGNLPNLNFLKPSSTSPALGAGLVISGLTIDGAGNTYSKPPAIGAYDKSTATVVPVAPTVSTTAATSITSTTAMSGGNVISDGGAVVTARGVCYSTSSNPTISSNITTNGNGTGSYISNLTGLSPNTKYYVRAYATNSQGTSYGNQISFTTNSIGLSPVIVSQILI